MRRKIALSILTLFLIVDALAWVASYRAANAPSPEQLRILAGATPTPQPSAVEQRGDGFYDQISLNGEWRYRQTGSELAPPSPSQGEGQGEGASPSPSQGEGQGEGVLSYFSPDLDVTRWHTMTIPSNWYLAGLNYHGVVWFRREFLADSSWRGRAVRLRFDGVDYFADVWLNGQSLGAHVGYFQPFAFDVAPYLNYGGLNVLAVRVESPYEEFGVAWPHRKTLIKGIFQHHDARPGGAWGRAGQEYNTGGIWNDVTLAVSDYVTVDDLRMQARWPAGIAEGADAAFAAEAVLTNHADAVADVTVALTLTPRNFESGQAYTLTHTTTLRRGKTTVELTGTLPGPRLWWPWERGDPNLYTARLTVHQRHSERTRVYSPAESPGPTLAGYETAFGFREVRVGEDWTWTINGQRFFPRGSNYVSAQWLSETNEQWFLRDVRLMRQANLNFVRVYAHVEPPAFYEATDELGLLVWQDFPLQWGYTDVPEFVDEALRQERDMITLLYNHPSIVVWCAHNESPWDTRWLADRMPDYDARQNKRLDELLRDQAQELDPTRYAHLNSGTGDAHLVTGWGSGRWSDFAKLPGAPFVTQYGAQALPNLETMRRIFTPQELIYDSGEIGARWEFHDFQPRETFDNAGLKRGEEIEPFIADSQAYQANLLQFATETYRRAKYDPMQGIFQFTFVENWPSITWAVVDYYRQPKAGYYALQTAMQPILPSIAAALPARLERTRWVYVKSTDVQASLWVVNDTLAEYPQAQLRWRIEAEGGALVKDGASTVNVPADGVRWATALRPSTLVPGSYTLYVELFDAQGSRLGHNEFSFAIAPPAEEQAQQP